MYNNNPDSAKLRLCVGMLLLALAGCQSTATQQLVGRPFRPLSGDDVKTASPVGRESLAQENTVDKTTVDKTITETGVTQASAVEVTPEKDGGATQIKLAVATEGLEELQSNSDAEGIELNLTSAVSTSLLQNPDLVAARGQVQVSLAAQGVAETYPWNPFVQSQLLPGTGNGASGKTNYYVWAMQRFELAHQQQYRESSASAALNQARWNIQQSELINVAQTSRVYFQTLYQHDLYNLAQESADLSEKLHGVVERRFEATLATAAEVTIAKVAARQSRRQADLAEANYQTALLALRQQLNVPLSAPVELTDRLSEYSWQPVRTVESPDSSMKLDISSLAAELVEGRPDVMAACAGVMVANSNEQLAHAARIPDLQAGPIYNTFANGDATLGVRVQMDVPVWNNGAPLAHQRHMERHQQSLIYTQLKTRAALEAQMAIDRYERARRLAEESRVELRPFSEQMPPDLHEMMSQFEAGQADVLAVFMTQNNLIQERRTYLDLLNELSQSAAAVIQMTALPPEHLLNVNTPR